MGFLKRWWKAIAAVLLTAGAMLAAQRATQAKQRAEKALQDSAEAEVTENTVAAQEALDRAAKFEDEARELKLQARDKLDRVAEQDESMADTLDRWKQSNRMRNRNP